MPTQQKIWESKKSNLLRPFYHLCNIQTLPTDAEISLHTPLVKYYNDLLGRQSSVRGWDEVTHFSAGHLFCTHLRTKYANFQEKKLCGDFRKKVPNSSLGCIYLQFPLIIPTLIPA